MRKLNLVTILIVLIFATATILAAQAYQAARSDRQSAERVVRDYAQFAAWEFERVARADLQNAIGSWSQRVRGSHGVVPSPAQFTDQRMCKCGDFRALTVFRATASGVESTGEQLSAGAQDWLRKLAVPQRLAMIRRSPVLRAESTRGRIRVVVARAWSVEADEAPAVEGLAMDTTALERVFRDIFARKSLLPPSLAGKTNSLLAIDVRLADGTLLYSSGVSAGAAARAGGGFGESFEGLVYEVQLKREVAGRLVIGGLPRSRLPVLGGLLALTCVLAIAALLQLRRERRLNTTRADFVSSVSHELRTPLAQIRLFSETLLLNRVRSDHEARRALEIIQQEAGRLAHLVENVLFFSRSERGTPRVSPKTLPLAPLVADLVEAFGPLARSRRSQVTVEVHDTVDAVVDPAAFRQILLNLLDNAVKYGRVDQTIRVAIDREGDNAVLRVSDEGPGIPAHARTRIFAPYSRLVTASTSAVAGTGIGLTVVRELVRLHGGSIRVEEAPSGGASFIVVFRAAPRSAAPDVGLAAGRVTA